MSELNSVQHILKCVLRTQSEIEALKKSSHAFTEPYLSEGSRMAGLPRNNQVLSSLTHSNWHIQSAICALEHLKEKQ